MDSELTELDDWVGTLEELQLGLERKCPPTSGNRMSSTSSSAKSSTYLDSHNQLSSSSPWRVTRTMDSPPVLPPRRGAPSLQPTPSIEHPMVAYTMENGGVEEGRGISTSNSATNTLTQSIRASFNPLSCKEATAENDLNCLLRQLEEVENTMKQLEQDDGDFTRRYSLASSSTTDPNTGCNPSPAPDDPGRTMTPPPLPPPLHPLTTKGYFQSNEGAPQSTDGDSTRPSQQPRSLMGCLPSPPNADYDEADEIFEGALTAPPKPDSSSNQVPNDGGKVGAAPPLPPQPPADLKDRGHQNGMERHRSMEMTTGMGLMVNRLSFDASSTSSGCTSASSTALCSPPPHATTLSPTCAKNEGSPSDKSMTEFPELSKKLNQVVDLADRLQLNKLVVRIFRPDRTTKAILIDQRMTAGEVASMLIEKNFLEPSIKLCLVEKVPTLKVERVFEESELVAECILSWPIKSQNMIFFESRDDQFGFIESPKNWLGDSFASTHGFHGNDSAQKMLENFTASGLAEWHDFLYIRKPGEKTWTRRMCVLRNSGLYATKKNKKAFSASDLVRLLVLDDKLHIYTTTGGWSRMRAPTPHGFALKTYAAQDFSSSHVFCFCAPDENALKQWACRLRLAKYGINLLQDYQVAKERISKVVSGEPHVQKNTTGIKHLTQQSSIEFPRSTAFQTAAQSPLPKHHTSANNSLLIRQASMEGTMTPPPALPHMLSHQRVASLTPQPTGAQLRRPFESASALANGYVRHHSTGAPPQHFYIR